MPKSQVIIVGGGIAGLCCARYLHKSGISSTILESADQVGGRATTEEFQGFRLDRGFQVLLTAYPEAKQVLAYERLHLRYFEPGALIRFDGKFHRFVDPWRRPRHLLTTVFSPIASLADKLRVARLRRRVCRGSLDDLHLRPEQTTMSRLQEEGFSQRIIDRFFKPFLGGVFLESELNTSSRKFDFVFRMFSQGDAAIPVGGMGAIAKQLAADLPSGTIQINKKVVQVSPGEVSLEDGQDLTASQIVIACEAPVAARLLGQESQSQKAHGATCMYFSAASPPISEPILVLNGDGHGPINNLCVPSQVDPNCAPAGRSLISVTVPGDKIPQHDAELHDQVVNQLLEWYGPAVKTWQHLKTFKIPYALPIQNPDSNNHASLPRMPEEGIILCGDYMENASINGAMVSGRRAAESILSMCEK